MQPARRASRAPKTPQNPAAAQSRLPSTGRASDMRRMSWAPSSANRLSGFTGRPSIATLSVSKPDIKKRNKEKVAKFLCEVGYEMPYIEKMINTKAGYKVFFEAIVGQLFADEGFSIGEKLEVDVPEIMRQFDYPYPIKAAYFQPIGVMHTFPHLLQILAFLVDIFETYDHMSQNPPSGLHFNDSQDSTTHAYNYAFILTTFKKCYQQQDGSPTDEFLVKEREAYIEAYDGEEELATEYAELQEKADEFDRKKKVLEMELKALAEAEAKAAERTASTKKINEYLELKAHENERKLDELKRFEAEEEQCNAEMKRLNSELEDVKRRLATQSLSGEEARDINRECQMLNDNILAMGEQIQVLKASNDEASKKVMNLGNTLREEFGRLVSAYESLWHSSILCDESSESYDFETLRHISPVQIVSEMQEGKCIQEIHEKLMKRLRGSEESIEEAHSKIRDKQVVLENEVNCTDLAIHKAKVKHSGIVGLKRAEDQRHENELNQLKNKFDFKIDERRLYNKERPDVAQMRENLLEEQKKLIALQCEYENACKEKGHRVLMETQNILSEMESIENGKKRVQEYEDDVMASLSKVLKAFNKGDNR